MASSDHRRQLSAASTGGANISSASRTYPATDTAHAQSSAEPSQDPSSSHANKKKKRKHRGGRGKKLRRQSFAAPPNIRETDAAAQEDPDVLETHPEELAARSSFYRLHQGNRSNTSISSEALLDHRLAGVL
jgi:magnesium transporter